jgi:muramoyltetrapeptide carboxypeptidase
MPPTGPLREPPVLQRGARVALVAPSGPLHTENELVRAADNVRSMGWEPVIAANAMARDGYFAGDDAQRLGSVRDALADPTVQGLWCLRGGYGAARLLPDLEPGLVAQHPKTLIGYSDITALHALWQRAGLVSFHGPTARAALTPFSRDSFVRTLQGGDGAGEMSAAQTLRAGTATGRLAGGNLALVASLCGTPWAIDFRGAIVVLEDIHEATYRLDRMLTQLRQADAFAGCAGLLFGNFTECPSESDDGARALDAIAQECADACGVPAVLHAPFGHIDDQWTLPLGAVATLDASFDAVPTLRISRTRPPTA